MNHSLNQKKTEADNSFLEAVRVVRRNCLLILGSICWWVSHYLLLWSTQITSSDTFIPGYDGRFILTVAATVVCLGVMVVFCRAREEFKFSAWKGSYILFSLCGSSALVLMIMPEVIGANTIVAAIGAVLSGVGGSFALILYGELHQKIGFKNIPIACAFEVICAVTLYFALSLLPDTFSILIASVGLIGAALFYWFYSRYSTEMIIAQDSPYLNLDVKELVILALLTGLAYGLVRTFAIGGRGLEEMNLGLWAEGLGTLICAGLLIAVFFMQKKQSFFEQCMLVVVPLVATGLLFVPLQGISEVIPTSINTGGFACFFNLIWYFAAAVSATNKQHRMTFLVALLFFASQSGQLLGAIVPSSYSNALSSAIIYVLLLITILIMYVRTRSHKEEPATPVKEEIDVSDNQEEWKTQYGLSQRENEIAALLIQRVPYSQIGKDLYVSENTVKTHARNIYRKVDVSSREELKAKLDGIAKKG